MSYIVLTFNMFLQIAVTQHYVSMFVSMVVLLNGGTFCEIHMVWEWNGMLFGLIETSQSWIILIEIMAILSFH